MSTLVRMVLLLGLAVLASGCTVKLAYNNLDRLVRWQVADYVDFNAEQEAYFRAELDALLYWHRTAHLPRYADRAELMASELDERIELAQVESLFEQMLFWGEEFEGEAMPMVVELLLSLDDEQVAGLPQAFARSNEEFMEDEVGLSVPEAQKVWRERVEDALKYFAGRLNREQRDYLAAQAVRYRPEYVQWAEYRARWQAAFMEALEQRAEPAKFEAAFLALVENREQFYGEQFAALSDANEALGKEVLMGLLARLDDRQTARFQNKLRGMAEDFRELSAAAKAPEAAERCLVRCG